MIRVVVAMDGGNESRGGVKYMKQTSRYAPFGNTLIVGAGPAAVQVAVHLAQGWCDDLGLVNRQGAHSSRLKAQLVENGFVLQAREQKKKAERIARLYRFYEGYDRIDDHWHTLVLCTPCDTYPQILRAFHWDRLNEVRTILLLSPGLGSNLLVNRCLGERKRRIEVISFSTYYAATKFISESDLTAVITKALKKRIYIASSHLSSAVVGSVKAWIDGLGIDCVVRNHPMEAESRSITMYVHPPLFMNRFSLREIFSEEKSRKYMYKIFPEGPITQHSIRGMVRLWKEISEVVKRMGAPPINLLQFLNDDNYPVHEETLSREDIESFMTLDSIKQEYLLYIRYSAILIDPFSTPDDKGRYFEFSAVPYQSIEQNHQGKWVIPRIPYEDYKKLKLLVALAERMTIPMPQAQEYIRCVEGKLASFAEEKGRDAIDPCIWIDTTERDADAIWKEMKDTR
jgi:hypothetical protein